MEWSNALEDQTCAKCALLWECPVVKPGQLTNLTHSEERPRTLPVLAAHCQHAAPGGRGAVPGVCVLPRGGRRDLPAAVVLCDAV